MFLRHKWFTVLWLALVTASAAAGFTLATLTGSLEAQIGQVALQPDILDQAESGDPLPGSFLAALNTPPSGPLNILLIGSDSRDGQDAKFGTDGEDSGRSDTTMLVHLPADRETATVVSIPRDLWVRIPECVGPAGDVVPASEAKFNDAYQRGGVSCTIKTVKQVTGLPVNHVAVVDFAGFENIVDAVGGVPVCLEQPINDPAALLNLPAGPQVLDGEEALGVARARETLGDGSDLSRIARQQALVLVIAGHVKDENLLTDPGRLYSTLSATLGSLATDADLASLPAMASLLWQVKNVPLDQVVVLTVPVEDRDDGVTVALAQPEAKQLFDSLKSGGPLPSWATQEQPVSAPAPGGGVAAPAVTPLCENPLFP